MCATFSRRSYRPSSCMRASMRLTVFSGDSSLAFAWFRKKSSRAPSRSERLAHAAGRRVWITVSAPTSFRGRLTPGGGDLASPGILRRKPQETGGGDAGRKDGGSLASKLSDRSRIWPALAECGLPGTEIDALAKSSMAPARVRRERAWATAVNESPLKSSKRHRRSPPRSIVVGPTPQLAVSRWNGWHAYPYANYGASWTSCQVLLL